MDFTTKQYQENLETLKSRLIEKIGLQCPEVQIQYNMNLGQSGGVCNFHIFTNRGRDDFQIERTFDGHVHFITVIHT